MSQTRVLFSQPPWVGICGQEVLAAHTHFVNSYPSVLQTCYNMSATKMTGEMCAGIVKGAGIFPKNANQHMADLETTQGMQATSY